MERNADYYHRIIKCVGDDEGEVVIVISVEQMKQAGFEFGDELLVVARENEIVIRKT